MKPSRQKQLVRNVAWVGIMAALVAACGSDKSDSDTTTPTPDAYQVDIRRTTGGVPHIKANDYASAGYGLGYVWAEDHACTMSGRWLTTGAQTAARFGANGPDFPFDLRNGNLASDLYFQKLIDQGWLDQLLADQGPTGILPEVRELVRGYVAGYNRYLKEVDYKLPDERCAGADWIRPITERDLYLNAAFWADMLTAVHNEFSGFLAAVPPGTQKDAVRLSAAQRAALPAPKILASNMVALGKDATRDGTGMVFSNPHWEWNKADGMVAAHLTIPGKLNVNGMTFGASPVIGIGHNDSVGWAATSAGATITNGVRYRLDLVPGSPTSYLVDGKRHEMVPTTVTVQVRGADGKLSPYTHTFYETLFGTVSASTDRPWTAAHAYTWKHSPLKVSGLNMWHLYSQAKTVQDIHAADKATLGVAWINSTAADSQGHAYRSMPNPLPYVTDAMMSDCAIANGILDGSRTQCAPVQDDSAIFPGIFPSDQIPYQFRDDYVYNANDSYWITNLRAPLEGYPSLYGKEKTVLSNRSRGGLEIIEQRLQQTDGLPGKGFTLEQFIGQLFDGRDYARTWLPELVPFCQSLTARADAPAQLPQACAALAGWNGSYLLDDKGAVLFRRFLENSKITPAWYTVPFDANDPLNTPRGLNLSDEVRLALYAAVNDLTRHGIALDASLRGYQHRTVKGERIAVPGGAAFLRMNTGPFQGQDGWEAISGSSFIYWVEMTPQGPRGKQIQVQGQSDDANSPLNTEQTRLFRDGKYLDIRFTEAEIQADPKLTVKTLKAQADGTF
ncbi:penicillin acylase family protein [Kerstersia sp.]|uniref:penicillin acylase family protein n=1 Tax=Kerstersia sp. TaxID=1930783 RepID=UPI003F8FA333